MRREEKPPEPEAGPKDIFIDNDYRRQLVKALREHVDKGRLSEADKLLAELETEIGRKMDASGFHAEPSRSIMVTDSQGKFTGIKQPACDIQIDVGRISTNGEYADNLVQVIMHEKVHGRKAFGPGWNREYSRTPGYEEGLAEGLSRHIAQVAGLKPYSYAYEAYVTAYETLAAQIGITPSTLYKAVFRDDISGVRGRLFRDIDELWRSGRGRGQGLAPDQWADFEAVADDLFDRKHIAEFPLQHRPIEDRWRKVLQPKASK